MRQGLSIFFEEQEVNCDTKVADTVSFADASIAWPTDRIDVSLGFSLRDINLSFPNNEFSIISGKTGSGKSLLLAAIIEEAENVSGATGIPKPL